MLIQVNTLACPILDNSRIEGCLIATLHLSYDRIIIIQKRNEQIMFYLTKTSLTIVSYIMEIYNHQAYHIYLINKGKLIAHMSTIDSLGILLRVN